ncbi:hypothetical protein B1L11_29980 [Microbispora sp. GKU 823]|nr:hypothetical protein B1L11_29980 [Microbispora sp. GKU 823]
METVGRLVVTALALPAVGQGRQDTHLVVLPQVLTRQGQGRPQVGIGVVAAASPSARARSTACSARPRLGLCIAEAHKY